jgi:hypothetical protein
MSVRCGARSSSYSPRRRGPAASAGVCPEKMGRKGRDQRPGAASGGGLFAVARLGLFYAHGWSIWSITFSFRPLFVRFARVNGRPAWASDMLLYLRLRLRRHQYIIIFITDPTRPARTHHRQRVDTVE